MKKIGTLSQVVKRSAETFGLMPEPSIISHIKKLDPSALQEKLENSLSIINKKIANRQFFLARDEISQLEALYLENQQVDALSPA